MGEGLIEGQIRKGERQELDELRAKLRALIGVERSLADDVRFFRTLETALDAADAATVPLPRRRPSSSATMSEGRRRTALILPVVRELVRIANDSYSADKAKAWEQLCSAMLGIGMASGYAQEATRRTAETSNRTGESYAKGTVRRKKDIDAALRKAVQDEHDRAVLEGRRPKSARELAEEILDPENYTYHALRHFEVDPLRRRLSDARSGLELPTAKKKNSGASGG